MDPDPVPDAVAEVYDTDRFAQLYYASLNPPLQNLGLAARYMAALFARWSIPFAFLGGWAVYLRGGQRRTEDVDITVACPMQGLTAAMMTQRRICVPQTHGSRSIQIFVHTGGRWDAGFPNTDERTISIDIIINGYLGTPPSLANGTELLRPVPALPKGRDTVPVINIYYQFTSKLQAHYSRRSSGSAKDYADLVFLVDRYAPQIWSFCHSVNQEHRRVFYCDYAAQHDQAQAGHVASMLGL